MGEILRQKNGGGEIAVPLDLFFVGNADLGSIGCNLGARQPAVSTFYEVLESLRTQSGVQDIWVRICDAKDPSTWPYSETVYILTALLRWHLGHFILTRPQTVGCMANQKPRRSLGKVACH
jgi:hypothetical protein